MFPCAWAPARGVGKEVGNKQAKMNANSSECKCKETQCKTHAAA